MKMRIDLDDAITSAKNLHWRLDRIYKTRERGENVPAARLKLLEKIVEDCTSHPAFATAIMFRKDRS